MTPQENPAPVFGRYRLRGILGKGGMAVVFLAEMQGAAGFSSKYALKVLRPQLLSGAHAEKANRSFISEARLGGSLHHPNIVRTLDFGQIENCYYLAMDYVNGPSLRTLLRYLRARGERMPADIAIQIWQEVATGLAYAHGAADDDGRPLYIVHRDIKPANVLLSLGGQVMISDFGVARAESNLDQTLVAGIAKGTAPYMSPEQATGSPLLDHRSDLFSLCLIGFEMLTGERLYDGEGREAVLRQACLAKVDARLDSLERIEGLPMAARLKAILRKGLHKQPSRRYQSGAELRHELDQILEAFPRVRRLKHWLERRCEEVARQEGAKIQPINKTVSGEMSEVELGSALMGSGSSINNIVSGSASMELESLSVWGEGDDDPDVALLHTDAGYRVDSNLNIAVPSTSLDVPPAPEDEATQASAIETAPFVDLPAGPGGGFETEQLDPGIRRAELSLPADVWANPQLDAAPTRGGESTVDAARYAAQPEEEGGDSTVRVHLDAAVVPEGGHGNSGAEATVQVPEALIRASMQLPAAALPHEPTVEAHSGFQTQTAPFDPSTLESEEGDGRRWLPIALAAAAVFLSIGVAVGWSLLPRAEVSQAPVVVVGGAAKDASRETEPASSLSEVPPLPPPTPTAKPAGPKVAPAPRVAPNPVPLPIPPKTAPPSPQPRPAAPKVASAPPATLNAGSKPAAELFIDGKSYGETPVARVSLKPGKHSLLFKVSEAERVKYTLEVASGEAWKCGALVTGGVVRCQPTK